MSPHPAEPGPHRKCAGLVILGLAVWRPGLRVCEAATVTVTVVEYASPRLMSGTKVCVSGWGPSCSHIPKGGGGSSGQRGRMEGFGGRTIQPTDQLRFPSPGHVMGDCANHSL